MTPPILTSSSIRRTQSPAAKRKKAMWINIGKNCTIPFKCQRLIPMRRRCREHASRQFVPDMADVREIALCVEGRILLLLFDGRHDATLFKTDLPVLLKAHLHGHVRYLLLEVFLLHRESMGIISKSVSPVSLQRPQTLLGMLKSEDANIRNQGHERLSKIVSSGTATAAEGFLSWLIDCQSMNVLELFQRLVPTRYSKDFPAHRVRSVGGTSRHYLVFVNMVYLNLIFLGNWRTNSSDI